MFQRPSLDKRDRGKVMSEDKKLDFIFLLVFASLMVAVFFIASKVLRHQYVPRDPAPAVAEKPKPVVHKFKDGDCVKSQASEDWENMCTKMIVGIGRKSYHVVDNGCALQDPSLLFDWESLYRKVDCPDSTDWR